MMKISRKDNFYRTLSILGVKIDFINLSQVLNRVNVWVKTNKQYQITTPNPEHIIIAQDDYRFRNIINSSCLRLADGVGLVWAAKVLGNDEIAHFSSCDRRLSAKRDAQLLSREKSAISNISFNRLSGTDLMLSLCQLAAQKKWRVFLLGGKNNVAANATHNLVRKDHPLKGSSFKVGRMILSKNIAFDSGPQNIGKLTKSENENLIKKINKFHPHLLFVAYGAPVQEKWISANLAKLNVKIAMGVGGAFDYLAGRVQRAPEAMRKRGLEWLWRLVHEPWRWKRQLRLIKFAFLILKERYYRTK